MYRLVYVSLVVVLLAHLSPVIYPLVVQGTSSSNKKSSATATSPIALVASTTFTTSYYQHHLSRTQSFESFRSLLFHKMMQLHAQLDSSSSSTDDINPKDIERSEEYPHADVIASTATTDQAPKAINWADIFSKAKQAAGRGGFYGAIAGSIQVLSLMWLRTIINYQYRYGVSMQAAMQELYREGGILRFYRGMPYALIQNPLAKFGSVAANEASRLVIEQLTDSTTPSPILQSLLGTMLSVAWRLVLMPLETVKTVLQVDGSAGLTSLVSHLSRGHLGVLYEGSAATLLSTITSHYPWFLIYNYLDQKIAKVKTTAQVLMRSAMIGFIASAVSDTVSNFLRVVKTVKQALAAGDYDKKYSYVEVIQRIYGEGGWKALLSRGLATRIIANGLQSIVFVVVWKLLPLYFARQQETSEETDQSKASEDLSGGNGSKANQPVQSKK